MFLILQTYYYFILQINISNKMYYVHCVISYSSLVFKKIGGGGPWSKNAFKVIHPAKGGGSFDKNEIHGLQVHFKSF